MKLNLGPIGEFEFRKATSNVKKHWFSDLLGLGTTKTNIVVNEQTAMSVSAVFSCVRIISETVASLPLITYERTPDGKRRATKHPIFSVLHDYGNDEMTAFNVREIMQQHLCTHGTAYAEKELDGAGRLKGLWPLPPTNVTTVRNPDTNELAYQVVLPNGQQVLFPRDRIFKIVGFGGDGIKGASILSMAREAIGLAIATEQYGASFFGSGARPGGVLEHPGALTEEAAQRLRSSWNEMHSGLDKSHRIAILEEGMSYRQIGLPPEDSQFLQTRKFQIEEICRIFRVPPHLVGSLDRATFSNIEHQGIDFVVHTIRPWLVRWEQAILSQLLTAEERKRYFAEHNVDGLLRGDVKSRYEAYAIGRQNGWLSADDIRELENQNPLPDGQGKKYLVPLNMVDAAQAPSTSQQEEVSV